MPKFTTRTLVFSAMLIALEIVLDVGTNISQDGHLCGDVAFDRVSPIVKAVSPVPKGVGAVTTAVLARHVIEAAEKRL